MAKYSVTIIYDASFSYDVEAGSPEEAASKAYDMADAWLCHQCSDTLNLGDAIRAIVHNEECTEQLYDDGAQP